MPDNPHSFTHKLDVFVTSPFHSWSTKFSCTKNPSHQISALFSLLGLGRPLQVTQSEIFQIELREKREKKCEKCWTTTIKSIKRIATSELTLTLLRRLAGIPCLVVLFIVSCANFILPRDPLAGIKHLAALFFNSQVAPNKRHLVRLLKIHSHAKYRFRLISDASGTWFFSFSLLRLSLRE